MPQVALVLVSHSAAAAEGTAEIARQMAPDVLVLPAGGTDEGIGTSFDRVLAALEEGLAAASGGVVVLTDLGSAVLTTESVVEMVDDPGRVRMPSAPFVEGAVTAAVEAQQGGDLAAVTAAAVRAGSMFEDDTEGAAVSTGGVGGVGGRSAPDGSERGVPGSAASGSAVLEPGRSGPGVLTATVVLTNPLGLHARPAALLARTIAGSGAQVTVDGVDGASVLALMALGATGGRELTITASGSGAEQALQTVVDLVADGFGEA